MPLTLLKRGTCEEALITDIHEGPIEVARRRVEAAGFSDACRFVLTDGLDDVDVEEGDVLLISGLGGENIAGIIERGHHKLYSIKRLVLQPQTKENVLREAIHRLPLSLLDELIAIEDRRPYLVMICEVSTNGYNDPLSELHTAFGPRIMERIGCLLRASSDNIEFGADARTALETLFLLESIEAQDRSRIVYLLSKLNKIARRAHFHMRDQQLLISFEDWFSSQIST